MSPAASNATAALPAYVPSRKSAVPPPSLVKVAVTSVSAVIVSAQVGPVHAPDHPSNVDENACVESSTWVPSSTVASQTVPQPITPSGVTEVTTPAPPPALFTVSVNVGRQVKVVPSQRVPASQSSSWAQIVPTVQPVGHVPPQSTPVSNPFFLP